jgi:hypothetical protein
VQAIIQQQYGQSLAAGKKRKRSSKPTFDKTPTFGPTSTSPIPLYPPPQYPPVSPILSPREIPDDNPDWSLDDVRAALPEIPKTSNKGKGRAIETNESADSWETGSSIHTGSSSNSIHSSAREGSIFSTSSTDRMYEDGACKVWYHSGGKALAQLSIAHIEVKRALVPSGACISVYARMSDSKIVRDDLWMSGLRTNASPFFEHIEIVNAMRQYHDPTIACVIKFAPNPADHPQYSFAAIQDGWEFVQHVTGKTLICSVNVASIKSACTHGNHVESGTDTIQVWEEEAEPGRMRSRTVKFFRNKNPSVIHQVVEFNCNALRPPEQDHRCGKVTFRFRDMRDGNVKDMRYIKIAFLNNEDKETFVHEVGFSGH